MPGRSRGLVVTPAPGFVIIPFNWGDGVNPIVTPAIQLGVLQGNLPQPGNLEDGDRIFALAGVFAKQDPAAANTGATFTIQFAGGSNTLTAPWGAVVGTMPDIPVGGGQGYANNNLDWVLPDPLRDNSVFAVTLQTAPVNAVAIALGIIVTYR